MGEYNNNEIKKRKKRAYRVYRRIRDLREDNDMTQEQVANLLNCSQRVYSNYERGDVDIPTGVLISLKSHYGTSVDYLLELTDVKAPLPESRRYEEIVSGGITNDER